MALNAASKISPKLSLVPAAAIIALGLMLTLGAGPAAADDPMSLGSATTFGVLAGSAVTKTGQPS